MSTAVSIARRLRRWALVPALTLAFAACGDGSDSSSQRRPIGQPQGSMGSTGGMQSGSPQRDLPAEVAVPLDSGNMWYRRGNYRAAAAYFRKAAQADPSGQSAGWFGVYMAEKAMGNDAAADSALSKAGDLSGAMGMHPAPGEGDSATGGGWEHPDTTGAGSPGDGGGSVWTHPDTTGGGG